MTTPMIRSVMSSRSKKLFKGVRLALCLIVLLLVAGFIILERVAAFVS